MTQLGGSGGGGGIAEDSAGVIDPGDGHVQAQYAVGHVPDALVAGGGSTWTASGRDGTISRIDRDRNQVTTIDVGGEPTALAFGAGSLWIADGERRQVLQLDPRTNRVVNRLRAGNAPRGVAVTGGAVWLTSAVDGQVERLDLARGGRSRRIDVPGGPAAIASGRGAVWVAGEQDGVVTKLDPRSGTALRAIGVGNGPSAIAVGAGGIWVANRDDGTVTQIDAATEAVGDTIHVGGRPVAVTAGLGGIWIADAGTDAVLRIDPRTHRVTRRVGIGSAPAALAISGGSVWTADAASRASHRGGTVRYESEPFGCGCFDPAAYGGDDWPVLSLTYDGLVAYRRIAGAGGSALVADLAAGLPQPADGGRTYTFQLRSGLRYSDGAPVRPVDFRASIERVVRRGETPMYDGIIGVRACTVRRCDLSRGIETDAAARTITIHLRRPDGELLHKLAIPLAYVLPARTPTALVRGRPAPGTGPYRAVAFSARRGVRLVRTTPRFRSWSPEARPDGFPDAINVTFSRDPVGAVRAVQQGRADAVLIAGAGTSLVPLDLARGLELTDASRVHAAPLASTNWLFLDVRARPFDDPRARRALAYALDRRRVIALAGDAGLASLTCQLTPPGLPGYVPTCPYTRDATQAGAWSAPDLARARRLIAASGTRGERVRLWGPPKYAGVIRYVGALLGRLGYRVHVRIPADPNAYFAYINDPHHHVQAGMYPWISDYLTPSSFFETFTCAALARAPHATVNVSQFCDRATDAREAAALAADGTEANARWAALDRRLMAAAPAIPLFNRPSLLLVSDRVGNAETHAELGPLLDQIWVH